MCEALAKGEKASLSISTDATIYYVVTYSCKTRKSDRLCRPYHQRTYGCLCTHYDVCWSKRNDRKRCPSSGGCGCNEEILRCLFWSHRRCRCTSCQTYQEGGNLIAYEDLGAEALRKLYVRGYAAGSYY